MRSLAHTRGGRLAVTGLDVARFQIHEWGEVFSRPAGRAEWPELLDGRLHALQGSS